MSCGSPGCPVDTSVAEERQHAEVIITDAALEALEATAAELGTGEHVVERVQHELEKQRKLLAADGSADDPARPARRPVHEPVGSPSSRRKREALLEMRDEQRIDDIVLRQVQARLDIEEIPVLPGRADRLRARGGFSA